MTPKPIDIVKEGAYNSLIQLMCISAIASYSIYRIIEKGDLNILT